MVIVDFDANKYSFELAYIYLSDCLAAKSGEEICSLSELIKFRPILQKSDRFVNSGSGESGRTLLYDNKINFTYFFHVLYVR